MSILYLDCGMGAAGDMLSAALLELTDDKDAFINRLNSLQIPGVRYEAVPAVRAGIRGTRLSVLINGEEEGDGMHAHDHHPEHHHDHHHEHHHHADPESIAHLVGHLQLPEPVKADILGVYRLIAEAESSVHGVPVEQIHFHEVGQLDAVADITAFCLLLHELAPEAVYASFVRTGSGTVRCAHGILPVPAPATLQLLKGIPVFAGDIAAEMCTPTGAALLAYFVKGFGQMPAMSIEAAGYGMGARDYETANCVRALKGAPVQASGDVVCGLSCNVDDMTAEEIGFAMDRLFDAGAKEVFTLPAGMKKSRPGTMICVICDPEKEQTMTELLFRHTTTLGIRHAEFQRSVLKRSTEMVDTPFGPLRCKYSSGYGVKKIKYEYDDLARIAAENGLSLEEVKNRLKQD